MKPNEYQQAALRTEYTPAFVQHGHDRTPPEGVNLARLIHAALGACTETGELQDMIKKHIIYGKPFDAVNILEECGDVLWYLALALDATGHTMDECMERNIAKLRKRFPERFTSEHALARNLIAERQALEGEKK
jgi:NTP pyrophosphatase (non-canonical NTP hydrolase)